MSYRRMLRRSEVVVVNERDCQCKSPGRWIDPEIYPHHGRPVPTEVPHWDPCRRGVWEDHPTTLSAQRAYGRIVHNLLLYLFLDGEPVNLLAPSRVFKKTSLKRWRKLVKDGKTARSSLHTAVTHSSARPVRREQTKSNSAIVCGI